MRKQKISQETDQICEKKNPIRALFTSWLTKRSNSDGQKS